MAVDPLDNIMRRIFQGGGATIVGSDMWVSAIQALWRELMRVPQNANGEFTGPRSNSARQASNWMIAQLAADENAYIAAIQPLINENANFNDAAQQQDFLNVANILNSGGQLTDTISTINQNIHQTRTEVIDIQSTIDRTINQTTTIFVDIPTPEEVLNDFRTAAVTYADTLFRAGDIEQRTRNFMLSNPNLLLNSYLSALGAKADAGENIFKVVGLEFDLIPIEQIGQRIGPTFQQEVRETIERIESGELTIEEVTKRVQHDLLSGANTDSQKQHITQTINEIFNQHGTTKTTEETVSNLLQLTTENIFQRPNLTTVFAFTPLDFFRERFTPQSLNLLAGIIPGRQQAEQQFAQGVAPATSRRL